MTRIYFVRHAQPDESWKDDRTRPLTRTGMEDCKKVTELLIKIPIDYFYSSPYKRSVDTIKECADTLNMPVYTDERFRERQAGENGYHIDMVKKRWENFDFREKGGESLRSVQKRNIEALNEILMKHRDKTIVIGTHGTALSTILNFYNPDFNFNDFKRIWHWMPYIIRVDFEGTALVNKEELLMIERGY